MEEQHLGMNSMLGVHAKNTFPLINCFNLLSDCGWARQLANSNYGASHLSLKAKVGECSDVIPKLTAAQYSKWKKLF